jgi:hypothetical protein
MRSCGRTAPAWALFILAPATAELLSGASPPAKFFNPVLFIVLCLLYGSAALLVRETALRWRKGWPTILTLGAAYGLIEEGLMVKSLFDPSWPGLAGSGLVGRAWGVNWVWGINLTVYHAVFSISLPILLVKLAFPASRPWVGRRMFVVLAGLLAAVVFLGFSLMTPYRPPALQYGLTALLIVGLAALARRLPQLAPPSVGDRRRPRRVGLVGLIAFLWTVALFGVSWGLPSTGLPPWLLIALTGLVVAATFVSLAAMAARGLFVAPAQRLSLAAGALAFFILLAPFQELGRGAVGMIVVGLAFLAGLGAFALRLRRDSSAAPFPQPDPSGFIGPPRG